MSINTYYSFIVFDIIKYKLLETEVIFITEVYDGGASTMDGKEEYDKGLELFYSNDVEKQREALNHFCLAAEKNHDEAMLYAGCILYYGWHGSLQNTSKAFNYFKKAVDCGIDGAKYYLAECYYKGKGVEPNIELAVQLVNDKYIFIELEDKSEYLNKTYSSIEEMKEEINLYNLPIVKDKYFAKKAVIILEDKLKESR